MSRPAETPPTPHEVAAGVAAWLEGRFGAPVTPASDPSRLAGGFDFWIYRVQVGGSDLPGEWTRPLVVRMTPAAARFELLQRETRLQDWAARMGCRTARVLALLAPGEVFSYPAQIVEHLPGRPMADVMGSRPWQVPRLLGGAAAVQAAIHAAAPPAWADGGPDWSLAERRLGLARSVVERASSPAFAAGLERVEALLPRLSVEDPVVCHGDFHPLNLLVDGRRISVIDWTDAGIGDRHGDVSRTAWLFHFGSIAAPSRAERMMLRATGWPFARGYLSAYSRRLPLDRARLQLWVPLHLLHAWAMAVADEAEMFGPSRAEADRRGALARWAETGLRAALDEVAG